MNIDVNQLVYEKFSGIFRQMISDQIVHLAKIDKDYKKMQDDISIIKENNSKIEKIYNGEIIDISFNI